MGGRSERPKWEACESEVGGRARQQWEAKVGGHGRPRWEAVQGRGRPKWEAV